MNWTAPLHKFYDENRTFLVFVFRFVLSFILMRAAYEIYLHYVRRFLQHTHRCAVVWRCQL